LSREICEGLAISLGKMVHLGMKNSPHLPNTPMDRIGMLVNANHAAETCRRLAFNPPGEPKNYYLNANQEHLSQ
jgi:hypothetical protein